MQHVLYFHRDHGDPCVEVIQDLALLFGAVCEVETDVDGVGITVHAPNNAFRLAMLVNSVFPTWVDPQ